MSHRERVFALLYRVTYRGKKAYNRDFALSIVFLGALVSTVVELLNRRLALPQPPTVKVQQVEVCAFCHPVYTGEYRGLMASGRVDRFRRKYGKEAPKPAAEPADAAKAPSEA